MRKLLVITFIAFGYLLIPVSGFTGDAETNMVVTCGLSSNGEPRAWALCTAGKLTEEEANKCLSGQGCIGKNNSIRQGMGVVSREIKNVLGLGGRQNEIYIVNLTGEGMAFSLTGSDPRIHGTHRTRQVVLQAEQGSLFHTWCQTSNATDMSTMYPYANHNTLPAAFIR